MKKKMKNEKSVCIGFSEIIEDSSQNSSLDSGCELTHSGWIDKKKNMELNALQPKHQFMKKNKNKNELKKS